MFALPLSGFRSRTLADGSFAATYVSDAERHPEGFKPRLDPSLSCDGGRAEPIIDRIAGSRQPS